MDAEAKNQVMREIVGKYYEEPSWHVRSYILRLNPEVPLENILRIFFGLQKDIESRLEHGRSHPKGVLVLENDEVIEKYQDDFRKAGISIPPNWKEKNSDYQVLLKAAKGISTIYEMVRVGSGWTYQEVENGK
ncbi:MAG: hypothetical protein NTY99_02435 [DPANN group archaeon]|nr:hypothetical protein [DPANN group archaeon]